MWKDGARAMKVDSKGVWGKRKDKHTDTQKNWNKGNWTLEWRNLRTPESQWLYGTHLNREAEFLNTARAGDSVVIHT